MPSPGLSSVLAGEGWARTSDNAVNSRALYQLSYDTTNGEGGGFCWNYGAKANGWERWLFATIWHHTLVIASNPNCPAFAMVGRLLRGSDPPGSLPQGDAGAAPSTRVGEGSAALAGRAGPSFRSGLWHHFAVRENIAVS